MAAVTGTDLVTDADKFRSATRSSLLRAEELGLKSIASPGLGTAYGAFSYSRAAEMMINTVTERLGGESDSEEVLFVLYSDEA
jgi:O-acetyl-ADP-ribose deacetylase (regulator of RNase III)